MTTEREYLEGGSERRNLEGLDDEPTLATEQIIGEPKKHGLTVAEIFEDWDRTLRSRSALRKGTVTVSRKAVTDLVDALQDIMGIPKRPESSGVMTRDYLPIPAAYNEALRDVRQAITNRLGV